MLPEWNQAHGGAADMLDRQVLQIQPQPGQNASAHPFTSYRDAPNLVVLGDPGAGKTELFKQSAKATDGHFLNVRSFVNTPAEALPRDKPLWIDGLDEYRSGRSDRTAIDRLIEKLHIVQPPGVRLSCRVADWLGDSDVRALASYFDLQGGAPAVVQLQPLNRDEQQSVLQAHHRVEPHRFLDEAQRRGLDAMLSNPQTLLMLHRTVQDGTWPSTRQALFEKATDLLLSEHNEEHSERAGASGASTPAALRDAAGALCALRLLSDCAGFCLKPHGMDDMPGWREIPLAETAAIQTALFRRIFVATGMADCVDYLHRTVAEYLGANWIAGKIAGGLPLRRVQALLGMDGQPASSLRGLHAWLAVLSAEGAAALIEADPMGVVMYADAAKLPPSDKRRLLTALGRTAERDPWFYRGAYAAHGIGALSDPSMTGLFRELLYAAEAPLALRELIVDALAQGAPQPALRDDLQTLLLDPLQPFALRDGCLDALLALEDAGRSALVSAYPELGKDEDGLRLRSTALRNLYGQGLGADDLVRWMADMLSSGADLPIGMTFDLVRNVPAADAPDLLDRLDFTASMPAHGYSHRKTRDLVRVYEGLLAKAIQQRPGPTSSKVHGWLNTLLRYSTRHALDGELVRALTHDRETSDNVLDAWIRHFDIEDAWRSPWYSFRRVFSKCFSDAQVVERILNGLDTFAPDRKDFCYRVLLLICFSDPPQWRDVFWQAHALAEKDTALVLARDESCTCRVEDWRFDRQEEMKLEEEDQARKKEDFLRQFDQDNELVASGKHLDWLANISQHFFGLYEDDDESLDPLSRLRELLGVQRSEIALAGLKSLVVSRMAPTLTEVIELRSNNQLFEWWHAIIAGLDLLSEQEFLDSDFPDDYLQSAIAIVCLYSTFSRIENGEDEWKRPWLSSAVRHRTALVRSTYASIVEAGLAASQLYPNGLEELKRSALSGPDRGVLVERLLRTFPHMHSDVLETMLWMAREDGRWPALQAVIAAGVAADIGDGGEQRDARKETRRLWLAFGFLTDPGHYRPQIEALPQDEAKAFVWPLLKVGSLNRDRNFDFGVYDVSQQEFVSAYAARHYPYSQRPTGISQGRENPWDVSDAIASALATLSSSTDDAAHQALRRLSVDPALETYAEQARHLLAQQHIRRVDARHTLCDWRSAAAVLENRAPASAQDLNALVLYHIETICQQIAHDNTDVFKRFWNEDKYGRVRRPPKPENSARDVLIDLLRPRLQPLGLRVEPEGQMAHDKRADIVVLGDGLKCVIELKRDYHRDVWTAAEQQLDRLYARDPQASGYGLYGVFWYGEERGSQIPACPDQAPPPRSAADMQTRLCRLLPEELRAKIGIVVIDVSGKLPSD